MEDLDARKILRSTKIPLNDKNLFMKFFNLTIDAEDWERSNSINRLGWLLFPDAFQVDVGGCLRHLEHELRKNKKVTHRVENLLAQSLRIMGPNLVASVMTYVALKICQHTDCHDRGIELLDKSLLEQQSLESFNLDCAGFYLRALSDVPESKRGDRVSQMLPMIKDLYRKSVESGLHIKKRLRSFRFISTSLIEMRGYLSDEMKMIEDDLKKLMDEAEQHHHHDQPPTRRSIFDSDYKSRKVSEELACLYLVLAGACCGCYCGLKRSKRRK